MHLVSGAHEGRPKVFGRQIRRNQPPAFWKGCSGKGFRQKLPGLLLPLTESRGALGHPALGCLALSLREINPDPPQPSQLDVFKGLRSLSPNQEQGRAVVWDFVLSLQHSCQDAKNKLVWIDTKYVSSHCSGSEQILICLSHLLLCKCLILNRAKVENHKAARKGLSSSSLSSSSSSSSQVTWSLGYFTRTVKPGSLL